jgi:predicted nucleic acid-binding protein
MDNVIYTYALIKSFYDQEEDYIDCFSPFVIKSMHIDDNYLTVRSIQNKIKNKFELHIPLHVLETILERLKIQDYVTRKQKLKRYKLIEKGQKYLNGFETDKQVNRRINGLFKDIKNFFEENEVTISLEEIEKLISLFLIKNIANFIEFIDPTALVTNLKITSTKSHELLLIKYIKQIENSDQHNYETFKDMVFGSLISVIIQTEEPEGLDPKTERFNSEIYLDANFVMSALGLHSQEFNDPAKELLSLLKKHNFNIKVFDFTIDEITRVLKGFKTKKHGYPSDMNINHIYASLNRKGWENSDVIDFISNIDKILDKEGIKIERTGKNPENYKIIDENLKSKINIYKPAQSSFYQNHDLMAIELIKEKRGKAIRKIEDSEALFLTSDVHLSKFNFIEMGHKDNLTICEVFLDKLLTNILWLKYPDANISLKSIIESYSRDLFIKTEIWNKFYTVLKDLEQEGKVKEDQISGIVYHDSIQSALIEVDEEEEITPTFVLGSVENAKKIEANKLKEKTKKIDKRYVNKISKLESKTQELSEEIKILEKEKNEEILKEKEEKKEIFRMGIEKEASIYLNILSLVMIGIAIFLIYKGYSFSQSIKLDPLFIAFAIIFLGGGSLISFTERFKEYLKRPLVNFLCNLRK